jgi:outer membrane protein TolC
LDEAIAQARLNRPDLQGAAVAVDAAKRNERSALARNLPRVEAFASYGRRSSYYNSAIGLEGWKYGASGQWNLFEGGATRGQKYVLRAERRAAEDKLLDTEHQIVSKLRELYQSLEHARVAMDAQEQSMSLSSRASRDARRLLDVGQASLDQVLQTGMSFRRAESRYNEAIYNYNAIIAEIEYAVGGRLSDSVAVPAPWKP